VRHFINLLVFTLFLSVNVSAQEGWFWLSPVPQGNHLEDVFVFDQNTAIAVGHTGTVMKATDGGLNWAIQHYAAGTSAELNCVHFINASIGWAVGEEYYRLEEGPILKTTDGGTNWISQSSGTSEGLSSVYFIDANTGWVVGGGYPEATILKTTDGGANWISQYSGTSGGLNSVYFILPLNKINIQFIL